MNSIPVMGTLIVNGVHWLRRLIASVDYPVDTFVIFNNNGRDQITKELDEIVKQPHAFIKQMKVCHMPTNLGCPAGWNLIIKSYFMAPYWIITNNEIEFGPGFLEAMVKKAVDPEVGVVHGSAGAINIGHWDIFLIKDWVVRDYGFFDENVYPVYCEDVDYFFRLVIGGVKRVLSVDVPYRHGEKSYDEGTASQTLKEEPGLKEKIDHGRYINEWEYITKKWGPGWREVNIYRNPYNEADKPLSYCKFDLDFIRRKYMGF
jgi:GT2 family glycosyltransferase